MFIIPSLFFISSIFEFIFKKENWINNIFIELKNLDKIKKIYFLFYMIIFITPWTLIILLEFFNMILLIILILISMFFRVELKMKFKKWRAENISTGYINFNDLLKIIIEDGFINIYNKNFRIIYIILSKKHKKEYKENMEKVGFKWSTGFSYRYIKFIIKFTKNLDTEKINKKLKIKIITFIKRNLFALIHTINEDFEIYEENICEKIKIKIQNFKIEINGFDNKILEKIVMDCMYKARSVKFSMYAIIKD